MLARLLVAALLCSGCNRARSPQPATLSNAQQVVAKYCVTCHSPSGQASELDWTNEHALVAHRRGVAAKVRLHSMPPPGMPQPNEDERQLLVCWAASNGPGCPK